MIDMATGRRRLILNGLGLASASVVAGAVSAAGLVPTPRQTPGPFYPVRLPIDSDNDLVNVGGRSQPASGTVTHVFGQVLTESGRPVPGLRVEIWQCDAFGHYHHPGDRGGGADPNFQGYGRTITASDGAYRFRTIRPAHYPGRTPHIHFAISGQGMSGLTTQMYVAGEPRNARDGLLNSIRDTAARESLIVPLNPADDLEAGALAGSFDIVLGRNLIAG